MPRDLNQVGTLKLLELLAEHCNHPQAHRIATELELRIVLIAGFAAGAPEVAPHRPLLPGFIKGLVPEPTEGPQS